MENSKATAADSQRPNRDLRVLVTGAAGRIGRVACLGLAEMGYSLTMLDRRSDWTPVAAGEVVVADIEELDTLAQVMAGHDAVLHLAATITSEPFDEVVRSNIVGAYNVFEAAHRAGVRRMIVASSNHAVGMTPKVELLGTDVPMRPDGLYGLSKVFDEALGRMYFDRFGIQVACLRIGTFRDQPTEYRHLATWLSHNDAVRLVDACLTIDGLRYAVVYGTSNNTRGWWDLSPARALGYVPMDDSETYAAKIIAETEPAQLRSDHVSNATVGGR